MENLPYLVAAYTTIAVVLLAYVLRLWRRQKALQDQRRDLGPDDPPDASDRSDRAATAPS